MKPMNQPKAVIIYLILFGSFATTLRAQNLDKGRTFLSSSEFDSIEYRSVLASIALSEPSVDSQLRMASNILSQWNEIPYRNLLASLVAYSNRDMTDPRIQKTNQQLLTLVSHSRVVDRASRNFGGIPSDQYGDVNLVTTYYFYEASKVNPEFSHYLPDAVRFVAECRKTIGSHRQTVLGFKPEIIGSDKENKSDFFYPTILGICLVSELAEEDERELIEQMKTELEGIATTRIEENSLSYYEFFALSVAITSGVLELDSNLVSKLKQYFATQQYIDGHWQGNSRFDEDPIIATSLALMSFKNLIEMD